MSEYEDLMQLAVENLAEGDSLLRVSESYKMAAEMTITKGHELRKQAEDIKAAEDAKAKEVEFILGEWVDAIGSRMNTGRHLSVYKDYDEAEPFPHSCVDDFGRGLRWPICELPKNRPGVFIRHVGNECPVSDGEAQIMVLLESGHADRGPAESFNWSQDRFRMLGYVIIPQWALERVK